MFEDLIEGWTKQIIGEIDEKNEKNLTVMDGEAWDTGKEQKFWKDTPDSLWKN